MDHINWLLFSFNGRISRKTYWLFTLCLALLVIVPALIIFDTIEQADDYTTILCIIVLWPSLAIQAKRWHDRDKSAWWILINLIPIIGIWALIENGFLPGNESENRYGQNPLTLEGE